jgi:hypothetical protein
MRSSGGRYLTTTSTTKRRPNNRIILDRPIVRSCDGRRPRTDLQRWETDREGRRRRSREGHGVGVEGWVSWSWKGKGRGGCKGKGTASYDLSFVPRRVGPFVKPGLASEANHHTAHTGNVTRRSLMSRADHFTCNRGTPHSFPPIA